MADTLPVDINRASVHALEVADAFEADGSFTVELRNHGEAAHVHLHLDDALSRVASLDAVNHYVEADDTREVVVTVSDADADEVRGTLDVFTGYGAEHAAVDVTVSPPNAVEVDETLASPAPSSDGGVAVGRENLLLAGLAVVAAVVAVGLATLLPETAGIVLGLLVLAVGVGVAIYFYQAP